MAQAGRIRVGLQSGSAPIFAAIRERIKRPLAEGRGIAAAAVMRRGAGSVQQQFDAQTTLGFRGARAWPRTKAFGRVKPPARTLHRTLRYRQAWLGAGAGSLTIVGSDRISVGVSRSEFPQVTVFQKDPGRVTVIRPRRQGRGGKSRMHWYLGLFKGAWIPDRVLKTRGLRNPSRPVRVNSIMVHRVTVLIREALITGVAPRNV